MGLDICSWRLVLYIFPGIYIFSLIYFTTISGGRGGSCCYLFHSNSIFISLGQDSSTLISTSCLKLNPNYSWKIMSSLFHTIISLWGTWLVQYDCSNPCLCRCGCCWIYSAMVFNTITSENSILINNIWFDLNSTNLYPSNNGYMSNFP